MSTGVIVTLVIAAVVVLAAIAVVARLASRRKHLRDRFGPEYDRTVSSHQNRTSAERELDRREKRHQSFDLRPLPAPVRQRYAQQWALIQEHFVDRPDVAVADADRLVTELMAERGYPTGRFDQQLADLSVEHGRTLDHYRAAHETYERHTRSQVATEDLRAAMVHYRALFDDLLSTSAADEERSDRNIQHGRGRA